MFLTATPHTPLIAKAKPSLCSKINDKLEEGLVINNARKQSSKYFHDNCDNTLEERIKKRNDLIKKLTVSNCFSKDEMNSIMEKFIWKNAIVNNDLNWESQNEACHKLETMIQEIISSSIEKSVNEEEINQKIYQCILTTGVELTYLPRLPIVKFSVFLKRFFVPIAFALHEWVGVLFAKNAPKSIPYSVSLVSTFFLGLTTVSTIDIIIDSVFKQAEEINFHQIEELVSKLLNNPIEHEHNENSFLYGVSKNIRDTVIEELVTLFELLRKIFCLCHSKHGTPINQRNILLLLKATLFFIFDFTGDTLGYNITKQVDKSNLDPVWKEALDYGGSLLAGGLAVFIGLAIYISMSSWIELNYPEKEKDIPKDNSVV